MKGEKFITQKPINPFLHKFISYYYFHFSEEKNLQKRFIYYPGYKCALTIYNHSSVKYGPNYSRVIPNKKSPFVFLYSGVQTQIRTAFILAPFDKIGIVFNALGINHFIEPSLDKISGRPIDMSFNHFGEDLINVCKSIYAEKSVEGKIQLLDLFFEKKYCDFKEERLKKCVQFILNSAHKPSVTELSQSFNLSRKTLLRWFNRHLCCSVKDYIDIVQFRKSLNQYLLESNQDSLTALALDNDYYDQAQFINHFKKLSGVNPKRFFKEVMHLGKEDTFWTFE